jgi:uncharacterized membrane protein
MGAQPVSGQPMSAQPVGAQKLATTDLGTPGGDSSFADGINSRGQVVGKSGTTPSSREFHAVLWTR